MTLFVLYKLYRWQETLDQDKSYRPPSPPPPYKPWNQLHYDFNNSDHVQEWEQAGYDYDSARKWIDLGVKPNELYLVKWIKEVKGLNPEYIRSKGHIADLRLEYRIKDTPKDSNIKHY